MKDILLHLDSYPDPTPQLAIDQAVAFAAIFDGRLSAMTVQVLIRPPSSPLANALIGLAAMASRGAGEKRTLLQRYECSFRGEGEGSGSL